MLEHHADVTAQRAEAGQGADGLELAADLAAVGRGYGLGCQPCQSPRQALDLALRLGAERVVICGSLYLAGEVLGASKATWPA